MENRQTPGPNGPVTPPPAPEALDDAQLPPGAWLARNGVYLALFVLAAVGLYYQFGLDGTWAIAKAALGLGFIIFIHELGHFAVAKWCDVHVQTFSLGFGPALPGCSFTRGETTYKLAVFPLGGYVKMVGEGDEEGGEDDPRSFKNKTVGQRMLIISAGVIMNVILGCVCFIIAFGNGVRVPPAVVAKVDPGSPAWIQGLPSAAVDPAAWDKAGPGMPRLKKLGSIDNPNFEDLKYLVMLSQAGEKLPVELEWPDGSVTRYELEARRDKFDANPVIGVGPPPELRLFPEKEAKRANYPPTIGAAALARALDLKPGDVLVRTTDPAAPEELKDLPEAPATESYHYGEFSQRLRRLAGKPMKVVVRREGGKEETLELPADGFHYDDVIVGVSKLPAAGQPYNPHDVEELPTFTLPETGEQRPNYFVFSRRMQDLAGRPVVLQVRRRGGAAASLFVPPAYHHTLGLRMRMGKVAAVREAGPAKGVVKPGDVIQAVELLDAAGDRAVFPVGLSLPLGRLDANLDPLRLPFRLRRWADGRSRVEAVVTVVRDGQPLRLDKVPWEGRWKYDQEEPVTPQSPWALPELGIAYQVETAVEGVEPGSPAEKAGLKKGDLLLEVRFKYRGKAPGSVEWGPWTELWTKNSSAVNEKEPQPWWPNVFRHLQELEHKELEVKVRRGGEDLGAALALAADPEKSEADWPNDDRGLYLVNDARLKKADNPLQALGMGAEYTLRTIVRVYRGLLGMITNRLPVTKNLRGPIDIGVTAYEIAGHDLNTFILFCGLISVNLAVINFLPIPLLDGGHMVFLIYEKLRGKPAPERVRGYATMVGLALLCSLMLLVIFLDVKRRIFGLG